MNQKEAEELLGGEPRVDWGNQLEAKLRKQLRDLNLKYVQNLETLERSRQNEFYKDRRLKVCKRVLKYLDAQERQEVLERERLILNEMDKEIAKLVGKISRRPRNRRNREQESARQAGEVLRATA